MAFFGGISNAVNSILTSSGTTNGVGIPNKDTARYPSLQGFMGNMMKKDDNSPSFTNLFSIPLPPIWFWWQMLSVMMLLAIIGRMAYLLDKDDYPDMEADTETFEEEYDNVH